MDIFILYNFIIIRPGVVYRQFLRLAGVPADHCLMAQSEIGLAGFISGFR
jgi:hypothetical protein